MIRPAPRRHWALLGLMALACLLATMGLTLHWRWLGILSLVMLAVGVIGMAMVFMTLRREVVERERLLRELNDMLDEQVQARTARLMQTIESLESFNRMVSHDLRSPMTSMMSGLDALSLHLEQESPELLQARISRLEGEVSRMANLVETLQQLAVISGRLPSIQLVDVSTYARQVLQHLQEKEPTRTVQWTVEDGLSVFGDPNLVRIALDNLLGNAWKYTQNRPVAEISVVRGQGEGHIIEVKDNGMGFDMNQAERLFQPFQRLHGNTNIPGNGIGLSIVKRVLHKHGGQVTCHAKPNEGATFRLEFPAVLPM